MKTFSYLLVPLLASVALGSLSSCYMDEQRRSPLTSEYRLPLSEYGRSTNESASSPLVDQSQEQEVSRCWDMDSSASPLEEKLSCWEEWLSDNHYYGDEEEIRHAETMINYYRGMMKALERRAENRPRPRRYSPPLSPAPETYQDDTIALPPEGDYWAPNERSFPSEPEEPVYDLRDQPQAPSFSPSLPPEGI